MTDVVIDELRAQLAQALVKVLRYLRRESI
jgi:hypothetical protein